VRDGDLAIRLMRDEPFDYRLLVRWRAEPHVHEWWDPDEPPPSFDEVVAQYGPRVRGDDPTTACIIEHRGRPIGYIQFYRWRAWPDAEEDLDVGADLDTFGLDIMIGEPSVVGSGLGARAVDVLCVYIEQHERPSWIAVTPEASNVRAHRAYEKAGFEKTRQVLELDTRDGQRVMSWLMERRREPIPSAP
jgi:aminoglycoside 6'-N-acetyltransferase